MNIQAPKQSHTIHKIQNPRALKSVINSLEVEEKSVLQILFNFENTRILIVLNCQFSI